MNQKILMSGKAAKKTAKPVRYWPGKAPEGYTERNESDDDEDAQEEEEEEIALEERRRQTAPAVA
jgi:hypothetical protein